VAVDGLLRGPILYLVADHAFAGTDQGWLRSIERVAAAVDTSAGPETTILFQLRVKDAGAGARTGLVARGLDAARPAGVPVLLNGDEDEARELGFAGVHWPEAAIPNPDGAPSTPTPRRDGDRPEPTVDGFLRIAAVHSVPAARTATEAGADAVVFGPVFAPGSKPGDGVGLAALSRIVRRTTVPVIAIGGIRAANVRECSSSGAAGAAVVSAVFADGIDPRETIDRLCAEMQP